MQKKKQQSSRRNFLKQITGTTLALGAGSLAAFAAEEKIEERIIQYQNNISPNDQVNAAVIGMGIMGINNVNTALKVPGVQLVAACDLYTGRLERAKELYGKDLFVTNDYRKILDRKDIDAVIIATSDHWHARISKEALLKGKHVYCEKPMVHFINEGSGVIAAQKAGNKTMMMATWKSCFIRIVSPSSCPTHHFSFIINYAK